MLRLNLTATPEWLTLAPGLRLHMAPLSTAIMLAARAELAATDIPADASNDEISRIGAKAIARRTVLAWEGVGDAAGNPVPVTPEGINALLEIWPVFEAFQVQYVGNGMLLEQEKNAFAPSPTGTSAVAQTTARPARPSRAQRRRAKARAKAALRG